MATFRSRLPSKREGVLVLAACAFPTFTWSILRYLRMVPAWEKYLGFWDTASILSYTLVSALIETLATFLLLVLLFAALPTPIVREGFVSKAATFVLVSALWAIVLHTVLLSGHVFLWTPPRYLLCATLYVMSVGVSCTLVDRCQLLTRHIEAFVDRLSVLLYAWVPLGVLSALVVIVRNSR